MSVGSRMHAVGHHLQKQAVIAAADERDAFARSSFNRYYYSAFLNIREMFSLIEPTWSNSPHKGYPEILKGKIKKNLNRARRAAQKSNDTALLKRIDAAKRAIDELAQTITTAYGIRIVADYEPGEPVNFDQNRRFSLKSTDVSYAHEWEEKSRILCKNIESVWREANE